MSELLPHRGGWAVYQSRALEPIGYIQAFERRFRAFDGDDRPLGYHTTLEAAHALVDAEAANEARREAEHTARVLACIDQLDTDANYEEKSGCLTLSITSRARREGGSPTFARPIRTSRQNSGSDRASSSATAAGKQSSDSACGAPARLSAADALDGSQGPGKP